MNNGLRSAAFIVLLIANPIVFGWMGAVLSVLIVLSGIIWYCFHDSNKNPHASEELGGSYDI